MVLRYMWRHKYNTSFYQLAEEIASPVTKSTVLSTIINRNDSTFPTDADYFKIIQICEPSPVIPHMLACVAGCQGLLSDTLANGDRSAAYLRSISYAAPPVQTPQCPLQC